MTKVVYEVKGMMCNHCVTHVKNALESLPGVRAEVTLEPARAVIEFSGKVYPQEELQEAVAEKAGDYLLYASRIA